MNKQTWKKFVGVLVLAGASTVLAVACGDDAAKTCSDTQVLAQSVTGDGEVCYDKCETGVCGVGSKCNSQKVCIPNAVSTNNTSTNNASTNNASTNNAATNNASTNNASTNNATNNTTNNNTTNPTCTPSTVAGACDPLCQTGCAANQACVAGGNPVMSVCQAAGPGTQGATCNAMMGCAVGFGCLQTSATATSGTCREFCKPGAATCGAGMECAPLVQDLSLGACTMKEDTCTVLPNSCPANQMCYNTTIGLQCINYKQGAMPGDTCAAPTDCGDSQACIGMQGGALACAQLCDPNNACPDAKTCNPLTDENGNALAYGACAL